MRKFTLMLLAATVALGFTGCKDPNVTPEPIAVEEITFSPATLSLVEGDTGTINATVLPADADDKTLEWSTSDAAIATVDQAGLVTAVKEGEATITATAIDGNGAEQECAVTVSAKVIDVTGIELVEEMTLSIGGTATLEAAVLPENATNKDIVWSVEDASVEGCVTVDEAGLVTAVDGGTATVVATSAANSEITAKCVVTVAVAVETITLDSEAETLSVGQTLILEATVAPANATNPALTWSVAEGGAEIISVDETGLVTALAQGTATVVATAADGSTDVEGNPITASCTINVVVPVGSIAITPESLELVLGETATVTAEVLPADATNAAVVWSVEGTAVTIDENGLVTSVEAGTATIAATAADGAGAAATIEVTVVEPHKYVVGELYPNETNPVGVVFSIENEGVNGKVVALHDIKNMPWGSNTIETPAEQLNGLVTIAAIQAADATFASFPLFTSINTLNAAGTVYTADSKGVWYLPAIKELRQLYAGMSGLTWVDGEGGGIVDGVVTDWGNGYNGMTSWSTPYEEKAQYEASRNAFNATIMANGGEEFTYKYGNYWSATQCFEGQAGYVYCFECYSATTISNTSKVDMNNLARPIMAF